MHLFELIHEQNNLIASIAWIESLFNVLFIFPFSSSLFKRIRNKFVIPKGLE